MAEVTCIKSNSRVKDEVGNVYGRLKVISRASDERKGAYWICRCECGADVVAKGTHLRFGTTTSCGCGRVTHGANVGGKRSPEYACWCAMHDRCENEASKNYASYGGRGITICERWRESFENFLADMGERPTPRHSLDRVRNWLGYEPGNCRWATKKQQSNNTRRNRFLVFRGESKTVAEWADEIGVSPKLLYGRLNDLGWSVERALTTRSESCPAN